MCCCWPGFQRAYGDIDGERDCVAIIDELAPLARGVPGRQVRLQRIPPPRLTDPLRAHAIDTVLITGTVTQICVEDTARGAFHEGFQAVVIADAVSSYAPELHRATLQTLAMKYGRVMTAQEALREMES